MSGHGHNVSENEHERTCTNDIEGISNLVDAGIWPNLWRIHDRPAEYNGLRVPRSERAHGRHILYIVVSGSCRDTALTSDDHRVPLAKAEVRLRAVERS